MLSRRNFILGLLTSNLIYNQNNIVSGHESDPNSVSIKQHQRSKDILIIVDVQNDFCPGGTLPVKNGDKVVDVINKIQKTTGVDTDDVDYDPKDEKDE